jgi:hypothetical protein
MGVPQSTRRIGRAVCQARGPVPIGPTYCMATLVIFFGGLLGPFASDAGAHFTITRGRFVSRGMHFERRGGCRPTVYSAPSIDKSIVI